MAIGSIRDVPKSAQEWATWSFAHMAHHRDINAALVTAQGMNFDLYDLDPIPLENPGAWIDQHQQQHSVQDAIFGIQLFDLSGFDPKDPEALQSWILQNYSLHYAEGLVTGQW